MHCHVQIARRVEQCSSHGIFVRSLCPAGLSVDAGDCAFDFVPQGGFVMADEFVSVQVGIVISDAHLYVAAAGKGWIVNRFVHWARSQQSSAKLEQSFPSYFNIFFDDIAAKAETAVFHCPENGTSHSHVRIKDVVPLHSKRQHQPFYKLDRKLAGVNRFLDVIILNVREYPHIPRVLSKEIPGELADFGTLEITSFQDIWTALGSRPG